MSESENSTGTQSANPDKKKPNQNPPSDENGLFSIRPIWFTIGFYSFLTIWAVYLLYEAVSYTRFEDYALPYLLIPFLLILLLLKMIMAIFPGKVKQISPNKSRDELVTEDESTDAIKNQVDEQMGMSSRSKAEQEKYEILMIAWVTLLPFMMYIIGMGWTVILYVFGFSWYFLRDIKIALQTTVGVTLFTTILFVNILDMLIWDGLLGLPDPFVYFNGILEILLSLILD